MREYRIEHRILIILLLVLAFLPVSEGESQTTTNLAIIGLPGDICFEDSFCVTKACVGNRCISYSKIIPESGIVSPNINTTIYGYNFTPNGIVTIQIVNATGFSVYGPNNFSLDEDGFFSFEWYVGNTPAGQHTIQATDLNQSGRNKNATIIVRNPYTLDGRIFDDANSTVSSQVYLYNESGDLLVADDETFNLNLSYGREYAIHVVPDTTKCGKVVITQILNNGDITGNFLGLSESENIELDNKSFSVLCGINPILQEYEQIKVTINHSSTTRQAVWKCYNWNFTNEQCIDGSWTKITGIADGTTQTNITLDKGDPGIGIASSCGDGVCTGSEVCGNCVVDCGTCPDTTIIQETTIRRSGGGGVLYVYSKDEKSIDLDIFPSYSVEFKVKDEFNIIYNEVNYSGSLPEKSDNTIKLEIEGNSYTFNEDQASTVDLDNDGKDDIGITLVSNDVYISYVLFERLTEVPPEIKEKIEETKAITETETKAPLITGQAVVDKITSTPMKALIATLIIGAIALACTLIKNEKKKPKKKRSRKQRKT